MASRTKPSTPQTPVQSRSSSRRSGAVTQFLALDLYSKGRKLEKNLTSFKGNENHNGVQIDTPRPARNAPKLPVDAVSESKQKLEPTTPSAAGGAAKRVRSQSTAPVSAKKGRRTQSVHPPAVKKEIQDIKPEPSRKKEILDATNDANKDTNDNVINIDDEIVDNDIMDIKVPPSDVDKLFEQADVLKGLLRQADDLKNEKDDTLKTLAKRQVELDVAEKEGQKLQEQLKELEKELAALAQLSNAVKQEEEKQVVKIEEVEDDDFEGKLIIDEGEEEEEEKENTDTKVIIEESE